MRALLVLGAAASAGAQNICAGSVNIMVNGVATQMQVAQVGGADGKVKVAGNTISMAYGPRAYIVPTCPSGGFTPGMYAPAIPLLGNTLSYTVDLSTVGCACNAAFYLTYMPAYGSNGQPTPTTSNDYYCDANEVSGIYCPEMDVMEGRYYPTCDRGGCGVNSYKVNAGGYGVGSSFVIDASQPYNVTTVFVADASGASLVNVTTTLTQGSAAFTMVHTDSNCGNGYLQGLSTSLASGMTMVMSLWGDTGSTMSWLDVPPCDVNTSCDQGNAAVTFSNIAVTPNN